MSTKTTLVTPNGILITKKFQKVSEFFFTFGGKVVLDQLSEIFFSLRSFTMCTVDSENQIIKICMHFQLLHIHITKIKDHFKDHTAKRLFFKTISLYTCIYNLFGIVIPSCLKYCFEKQMYGHFSPGIYQNPTHFFSTTLNINSVNLNFGIKKQNFIINIATFSANEKLKHYRLLVLDLLRSPKPNYSAARQYLGFCLHLLHSFYSNTNWIELSGKAVYTNLGMN